MLTEEKTVATLPLTETRLPLPENGHRDWKAWLRKNWAELGVAVLLLALLARITLRFRFPSS
jgi:hypothetical protein